MDENELKTTIAKNLVFYRKQAKLTQLELAQKLNYSDKAVSKWERAEGIPDIFILKQLADLFKITVNDLMTDNPEKRIHIGVSIEKRILVPIMSDLGIVLVATMVFGFLLMLNAPIKSPWLCFIFAIPAGGLCTLLFTAIWRKLLAILLSSSVLIWGLALSLFLTVPWPNSFLFFIIAAPIQVLMILWFILMHMIRRNKKKKQL